MRINEKLEGNKLQLKQYVKEIEANCYVVTYGQTCSDNVLLYCRPSFFGEVVRGMAALECPLGSGAERKAFAHPSGSVAYT